MTDNYLKLRDLQSEDKVDCLLTSNFDERYLFAYPQIKKRDILELSAHYPAEDYSQIKEKIKNHFHIKTNLVFGSGSEELIIRLNDIAKNHNYKLAIVAPLFYRVRETFDGEKTCINEEDIFSFNYDDYDVVWLQNPNLFSGNSYRTNQLKNLLEKFPKVKFFIDEAGIFTLVDWENYSLLNCCHQYNNLVVLSTFSKAYGLAGLRIGFASGSQELLAELEENNLTFPLSSFAEFYLTEVLDHEDLINKMRTKIAIHKKQIIKVLSSNSSFILKDSLTNCLFFKHRNKKVFDYLLKAGVICLDLDDCQGLKEKGYVRLTVHSSSIIHRQVMSIIKKIIVDI